MSSCCLYTGPGYPSPLDAFRNGNKEELIYVTAIVADESRPDYLATIDVNESSPTFGQVIHRLPMPFVGDELHHSGWNACSSCFGNYEAQRKFLILPGVKSGRIYAIDVRNPRAPVHHKYVDGEAIAEATSLAYPHTSHCLGDGTIMVSMMGYAKDGASAGDFLLLNSEMDILGTYSRSKEIPFGYDFWYQPHFNTMISTEFGTPSSFMAGFNPAEATSHYGHHIHVWNFKERTLRHSLDLGIDGLIPLEVRFAHDPTKPWAYVGAALSSNIIYLEIDPESNGN
jgi:selenium-binding protein 1